MGSTCCAARKNENLSSRPTGELLHRNAIYSPSWSFRRDDRRRVAGEIENISYGLSPGFNGDRSTEIKVELSLDRGSVASGRNLRITMSPKSSIREGLVEGHLDSSSDITHTNHGNIEDKSFKDCKETVGVGDSDESKIPIHGNPSSPSCLPPIFDPTTSQNNSTHASSSSLPPISDPTTSQINSTQRSSSSLPPISDPTTSQNNSTHPSSSSLQPISDPTTSQNNSTHPRQISGSPVLIGGGSRGGSSDSWSMRTFTELVASSQRERLSFDSDSDSDSSSSPSIICGICSELLTENTSVAVLACGHVYHGECLEKMTREEEQRDPSCPICIFGPKKMIKMLKMIHLSEEEEKLRFYKSINVKVETSWPFLRRHFSLGSKWRRSLSEKIKKNDRKGFWSRFH